MSNSIDQRIVQMEFDNASFEKNVSTTMATLKKLDASLDMKGGVDALKSIDSAVSNVNFAGMADGIETVSNRLSALGIIGATALAKVTSSVMDISGKAIKAVTIDPLVDGLDEYKLKMDSIKTIQANTGLYGEEGTARINKTLGELNTYADKTIYNFAEMTKNIGTFTAAGIGLEDSAQAIQGIANLAAVSGSSSQQASVAMYQLSQALAAGTLKLQDWNSVVNAGMGGKVFQDALVETSRALGTGADEYIEAEGSFRESLKKGWATQEVLTKTLRNFTLEATEANRAMLESEGYTAEQIDKIFQMASNADDAATKVKTFQQMIETTKESLGSGWAQTWEYIIGDITQAEELWTTVSKAVSGVIDGLSDARNKFFKEWNEGDPENGVASGWKSTFEALKEFAGIIADLAKPIGEAFNAIFEPLSGIEAAKASAGLLDFARNLRRALNDSATGQMVLGAIRAAFTALFTAIKVGATIVKTAFGVIVNVVGAGLQVIFGVIEALAQGLQGFFGLLSGVNVEGFFAPIADFFTNVLHADGVVSFFKSIGDAIGTFVNAVATGGDPFEAIKGFLDSVEGASSGVLSSVGDGLSHIGDAIGNLKDMAAPVVMNGLSAAFEGLRKVWTKVEPVFASIRSNLANAWGAIVEAFQNSGFSFEPFKNLFSSFSEAFSEFIDSLAQGDGVSFDSFVKLFGGLKDGLVEFLKEAGGPILTFLGELGGQIAEAIGGPFQSLYDWVTNIQSPLESITSGLQNLVDSISGFTSSIKLPWDNGEGVEGATAFSDAVDMGYEAVNKFDAMVSFIQHPAKSMAKLVSEVFNGVGQSITEFVDNLELEGMGELLKTFGDLAILGGAVVGLNELGKLLHAAETFVTGAGNFFKSLSSVAAGLKGVMDGLKANLKVAAITQLAVSVGILVAALYAISKINPERLKPSMLALVALIGIMSTIMALIGKMHLNLASIEVFAHAMQKLAVGIGVMAAIVALLGMLNPGQLNQGLKAITMLALVMGALSLMTAKASGLSSAGNALLEMAAALAILVVIAKYLTMNWQNVLPGAAMILAALGILVLVAIALDRLGGFKISGGRTLIEMAAALAIVGIVITVLAQVASHDLGAAWNAVGMVSLLLIELTAIAVVLSKFTMAGDLATSATAILAMCASLLLIAGAIAALTAVAAVGGVENLIAGWSAIAGMLIVMAAAVAIMAAAGPQAEIATGAMVALCVAVTLIAAAIAVLATMDTGTVLATAAILVAAIFLIVVAAAALFAVAEVFAAGVAAISVFAVAVGLAALMVGAGAQLLVSALQQLAEMGPEAVDSIIQGLSQLGQGLWNIRNDIALGIAGIGYGIVVGLASIGPSIAAAAGQLVISLAQGFLSAIPALAQAAMMGIVVLIASIAEGLHTYAPAIGEALLQLGVVIVEGLVMMLTEAFAAILGLVDGVVEAVTGTSPNFAQAARDLGQAAVDGLDQTMSQLPHEALDEVKASADAVLGGKGNMQSAGAQAGLGVTEGFRQGTAGAKGAVMENIGDIPNMVGALGGDAFSKLQGMMNGDIDTSSITSSFQALGVEIPGIGAEAAAGFEESIAAVDISDTLMQDIDSGAVTERLSEAGVSAAEGFNAGFHDNLQIDGSAIDISSLSESGGFSDAATTCATAYTDSLTSGLSSVSSIASNAGQQAVNGLRSGGAGGYSAGYSVGSNMSFGVAAGLWAGYGSIAAAAASIIAKVNEVMEAKASISSPSKMTMRIGRYLAEGVAVGMLNEERHVANAAGGFMTAVLKSMTSDYVDALMGDIDENPTIRPVLDLEEYSAGINAMNSMMPTDQYMMAGRIMGYGNVASPFSSSTSNSALYNINLNYTNDADANKMFEDLTRELHSKNLMEAH